MPFQYFFFQVYHGIVCECCNYRCNDNICFTFMIRKHKIKKNNKDRRQSVSQDIIKRIFLHTFLTCFVCFEKSIMGDIRTFSKNNIFALFLPIDFIFFLHWECQSSFDLNILFAFLHEWVWSQIYFFSSV